VPSFSFLSELSPNVVAAVIGAGATLIAAWINLRVAWRREVLDRLQKSRSNPRGRRGLLIAITILVVAAGVGGYAGALYMMQRDQQHTSSVRVELQQRIAQIQEAAARLEQTRLGERVSLEAEARLREERTRGGEGVSATVRIGPCRAHKGEAAECTEADALQASVCASIPTAAAVYELTPLARVEGDVGTVSERRLALDAKSGNARFGAQPLERTESETMKQVCLAFWSWDSQRALDVRLLVKYLLPDARETPRASIGVPVQAAN